MPCRVCGPETHNCPYHSEVPTDSEMMDWLGRVKPTIQGVQRERVWVGYDGVSAVGANLRDAVRAAMQAERGAK